MGWTFTNKEKGQSVEDFFRDRFREGDRDPIIACAVVEMRTAYLAYQLNDGRIIGGVVLLAYRPNDYYNFGYKDMEEFMGPNEARCPERILKLLSPIEEEGEPQTWAREWRSRCQEYIDKRKKALAVKNGQRIRFEKPISFRGGYKIQEFEIKIRKGKRQLWCGWTRCRLPDWFERKYTIIDTAK